MIDIDISEVKNFNPDIIIDARSPKEFSHSHLVNARNFYALNDKEHEEVGTIYKQSSKSRGKILGASYICKNLSSHVLELEKELKLGDKILIYCARGGMRSKSLGIVLHSIGYRVARVKNGYKAYRHEVLNVLEKEPKVNFITLFGNTGCGKSELIQRLKPSLDLEGLANHLGSTFGEVLGKQPSTKSFQNRLAYDLEKLSSCKYCFVEGESKRIGKLILPSSLYKKMHEGFSVLVTSSMEFRVKRILKTYKNIDNSYFYECMEKISPYIKKSAKDEILLSYKRDDFENVAYLLLENYYDKVYKKPQKVDVSIRFDGDIEIPLKKLGRVHEEIL